MRVECLKERFTYNRPMPVQRLSMAVADSTDHARQTPWVGALSPLCWVGALTSPRETRNSFSRPAFLSLPAVLSVEAQWNTQRYGGRPFGVGLLVAGFDVRCPTHPLRSQNLR